LSFSQSDDESPSPNNNLLPEPYTMSKNAFDSKLNAFGDFIHAVKRHTSENSSVGEGEENIPRRESIVEHLKIISLKFSMDTPEEAHSRPSFALRTLVKERLANIIAIQIAGSQSRVLEVHNGSSLLIKLGRARQTADSWNIPRCARKTFCVVAFEAVFYVGESAVLSRGVNAFYDLAPKDFHRIFSPLVVSFGDSEMLESWLASTDHLAKRHFDRHGTLQSNEMASDTRPRPHQKFIMDDKLPSMPKSAASVLAS
jgi:hypothetical protein